MDLIVYINEEGRKLGIHPLDDSEKHTEVMKTDALKQALDKYQFDAAFGGARRDEEKSRAKERVYSFRDRNHTLGSEEPAAGVVEPVQREGQQGREHSRLSAVQLDRTGRLAVHPPGEDPDRARSTSPRSDRSSCATA